jgi:hypothetical protein
MVGIFDVLLSLVFGRGYGPYVIPDLREEGAVFRRFLSAGLDVSHLARPSDCSLSNANWTEVHLRTNQAHLSLLPVRNKAAFILLSLGTLDSRAMMRSLGFWQKVG